MDKVKKLIDIKTEMENNGLTNTADYIRCLANINYFVADRHKQDFFSIKILFILGIERAYGTIGGEVTEEINKALDLMFAGDFKGYCLMVAIITVLEKCKEDKDSSI